MIDVSELKFDKDGLIPAIVKDADSGKVLTLAYMNRESLEISMNKKLTCFWSRSRQELWLKGETSGNYQHIVSITADCDGDALLVKMALPATSGRIPAFPGRFWRVKRRNRSSFRLIRFISSSFPGKKNSPRGLIPVTCFRKE